MLHTQVYGCSLPSALSSSQTVDNGKDEEEDIFAVGLLFAPKDVDAFMFTPKDDKHGLGYKGLDPSTALFHQNNWLGMDSVTRRVGRKGISGEVNLVCTHSLQILSPSLENFVAPNNDKETIVKLMDNVNTKKQGDLV